MQVLRKRILACFMVAFLSLFSVFSSYKDAQASASGVIGGGAVIVGAEYAFAWLLGALGLTAASVAVYENADSIKAWGAQQNREFCQWVQANVDSYNEWADVTENEINNWFDRVAMGTVDKSSDVWAAFRDWISCIYTGSYVPSIPAPVLGTATYIAPHSFVFGNFSYGYFVNLSDYPMWVCWLGESFLGKPVRQRLVALSTDKISFLDCVISTDSTGSFNGSRLSLFDGSTYDGYYYLIGDSYSSLHFTDGDSIAHYSTELFDYDKLKGADRGFDLSVDIGNEDEYSYVGGVSNVFDRDNSFDNVDLVGVGAGADAVEIPINWGNVGEESGILSDVVAGTVPWTDALSCAGVGVVDLSHDTVIGDEGETDEPIAGVVTPPTSTVPTELENYTVSDLSRLFPFCIPFDLIDFLGVLSADPEAPHFTWTFSYPTLDGMQSYDLQIDLSAFDSIAELLRDMECILFIVGLILITRDQMIKG